MSSRQKKRELKKKKPSQVLRPTPEPTPILSLPKDLLLSCFARVSRLYYPTLSLVSKNFRPLLASPELYKTRSSLGRNESCLYVCFRDNHEPVLRWFTLCLKPDRNLTNGTREKNVFHVLAPVSVPDSPPAHFSGLVAIGSNIYNIVGPIDDAPSSRVSTLDCKSHTWLEAPSMLVKWKLPSVNVLDGKIYVLGGCEDTDSSNWMEVFSPNTQTWEHVSCPEAVRCLGNKFYRSNVFKRVAIGNKVYLFGLSDGFAYEPKEGQWQTFFGLGAVFGLFSYCVIENVLFHYCSGEFTWLDTKLGSWRKLTGLRGLPKIGSYDHSVQLVDYGGMLAVLWDELTSTSGCKKKMVWCAVIVLDTCNSGQIVGNVEWCDTVLTVPKSYQLENAIAATV